MLFLDMKKTEITKTEVPISKVVVAHNQESSTITNKYKLIIFYFIKIISIFGILSNIIAAKNFYRTGASGYTITCLVYGTFFLFFLGFIKNKITKFNILLSISIIFCIESWIHINKKVADYSERNSNELFSSYHSVSYGQKNMAKNNFWLNEPNTSHHSEKSEYDYYESHNSMGLRDSELISFVGKDNIILIGDSFTEGIGAPQDSTGIKSIAYFLAKNPNTAKYSVINAGVSGSDIVYGYKLLTDTLQKILKPKIVIYNLNCSDIEDIIFRGDDERFSNGYRKSYWWEYFYSWSFIYRTIANRFHINPSETDDNDITFSKTVIKKKILNFYNFCKNNGSTFILVVTPIKKEVQGNYSYYFEMIKELQDSISIITPQGKIAEIISKDGNNYNNYYYPMDCHFTPLGYWEWGSIVANEILQRNLIN